MVLLGERIEIAELGVDTGQPDVLEGTVAELHERSSGASGIGELMPCVQPGLHEAERHDEGRECGTAWVVQDEAELGPAETQIGHRWAPWLRLRHAERSADRYPVATPKTAQVLPVRRSVPMMPRF